MNPTTPRSSLAARALLALMLAGSAQSLHAATIVKLDNTDNLNLTTSWNGGGVPGASDIASWDSTVTGANTVLLGANLTFNGLLITNPGGAVTISAGNTLTLLGGGIDMSAATQDLTINATVALGSTTAGSFAQTWNVAAGRTLTVAAVPTRNAGANNLSVGGVLNIAGDGTTKIGAAALALIIDGGNNPFVTYKTNDWAATDATGTVIAATYTNDAFTTGTNVNIITAGTYTTNGATPASVRFNNTAGTVTVNNTNTSTLRGVLMTSDAQSVTINGGFIRPNRVSTAGATMSFIQNSTVGDLTIGSVISNGSSSAPVSITKSGAGKMILNGGNGYTGQTFIHEGTLQLGTGGTTGTLASTAAIFNNGNFAVNHSDNLTLSNVISGTGSVTQMGAGELTLSGVNTYTGATNLNGGALILNATTNIGNGTAINFNGGALKYGTGVTTDVSTRTLTFNSGGATINTNGNNVTLANSVGNNGAGAFTKTGTGTLNLTAANTYTGGTVISAGTLKANNTTGSATGSGAVTINSGGILGGTGTVTGAVTVNSGGTLAAGNSVGTLTLGALTLASGSILDFEFNSTPANDFIAVTGTNGLTLNGGGLNLYTEGGTSPWTTTGSYNLFSFNGTLQGLGLSALSVLNQQAGYSYTFGSSGSFLTLTIDTTGVISNWNVDASGSWNTAGNWSSSIPNQAGASAKFLSAITAPRTITLDGDKTVGGLTFDNVQTYTINQGSGGTLTLDSGTASAASILVSSGNHVVNAPVALASDVTADIAASSSLAANGVISGSKGITKSGTGTLDLTGANTYSGGTTINAGTVSFGNGSLGSGAITLNGGGLTYNTGNTQDISAVTLTLGSSGGTINTNGNDVTFANAIGNSGSGGLTKAGTGSLTLGTANTYTGTTTITGGSVSIAANDRLGSVTVGAGLIFNGGILATTATMALDNGGSNARTISLGSSGGTLNVADATTLTASGVVSGTGSLTKSGTGSLSISGVNTYSGGTVINGGTVIVGGTGTGSLGTGGVAMNGATLNLGARNLTQALTVTGTNSLLSGDSGGSSGINTVSGSGTLNVTISGANVDLRGDLSGLTGTLAIASPTGNLRINGSTGSSTATFNLGTGSMSVRSAATAFAMGTLSGDSGSTLTGSGGGATQAVTYTIGAANNNSTFSGAITNGAGATAVTKTGTGTLTLAGASTYTGATAVNDGTLLVNGSIAGTAVTVGASGILGGSGTIGGATVINGALNPGNSPGVITFSSDLTLAGTTNLELNSTVRGTGYDGVNVGGTLTYGGVLNFLFGSTFLAGGENFQVFTGLDGSSLPLLNSPSFTSIVLGGSYTASLTNNTGVWTGTTGGYDFTFTESTGTLGVLASAVPEPSTYAALAGAAILGFAALRRRRRA